MGTGAFRTRPGCSIFEGNRSMSLLLAGLAAVAAYLLVKSRGGDAWDHLLIGITRDGVAIRGSVQGASGRTYDMFVWSQDASGRTFYLVIDRGRGAWISWWAQSPTGTRTLYLVSSPEQDGSTADVAEVAALRGDFGA